MEDPEYSGDVDSKHGAEGSCDDETAQRSAELLRALAADPLYIHRIGAALHCGDETRERSAARSCAELADAAPERLAPIKGRLLRVVGATEDRAMRTDLARALTALDLGRGEAGRLAFVFESWLEDGDPVLQRTALDALVALVPQRPALARRVIALVEARAALGSPVATRYGKTVIARLREF